MLKESKKWNEKKIDSINISFSEGGADENGEDQANELKKGNIGIKRKGEIDV